MSRYTRIDSGVDERGRPWQVGLSNRVGRPPTLVVTVPEGTAALYFNGDGRDMFARAVADALKPIPGAAGEATEAVIGTPTVKSGTVR
jgi:hypothetical protein